MIPSSANLAYNGYFSAGSLMLPLRFFQGSLIFPKTSSTTSEESELPEVSSLDQPEQTGNNQSGS